MIHVALYQPEIPPNTGNIARQCVGMEAHLHLIGPVRFDLSDRALKRAGLDYWQSLRLTIHDRPSDFLAWIGEREPWLVTRHGILRYELPEYSDEDILVFGSETRGLPEEWIERWRERTVYVPIMGMVRSYNLANTVGILLAQASLRSGVYDR